MVGKELVATTVSSREVGQKHREERKTTSSHVYTETHKKNKGTTQGKVKVAAEKSSNKADGEFPYCMREESGDNEKKK